MKSSAFITKLVFGLCAGLFLGNAIHAEDLSASQRLNGANTRKAFAKPNKPHLLQRFDSFATASSLLTEQ
tara:strand:- start:165 stop:374 length:210 start_codon:yes stop_codon:yes gene_type:complete